ncbi:MAG: hypothetical protein H5T86_07095 [Armatimonadetes bacterium]|nr:hypothetical protein [Armatimonadota bacterium]
MRRLVQTADWPEHEASQPKQAGGRVAARALSDASVSKVLTNPKTFPPVTAGFRGRERRTLLAINVTLRAEGQAQRAGKHPAR